ncbi:MAG: immunity 7 family protein [Oscillospiraceae bacterium]|nr:immunity 7 family protein [Oscillospiraceae bacterium]
MVELHGWLSIQETYEDEDSLSPKEIDEIMRKVKEIVSNSVCGIELKCVNGTPFVNTLICSNHRTSEVDDIIEVYKSISKTATGSYGVIYLRDDEDDEHYNEIQKYVFKRGTCIYKIDEDFSPCIPTIESDTVNHQ